MIIADFDKSHEVRHNEPTFENVGGRVVCQRVDTLLDRSLFGKVDLFFWTGKFPPGQAKSICLSTVYSRRGGQPG